MSQAEAIQTDQNHNEVTGLPNRRILIDTLRHLESTQPGNFSLLTVDLDGLKQVNDSQGHAAGNAMLKEAGRTMSASVRIESNQAGEDKRADPGQELDVVATHIHGDEFAIVLPDVDDPIILELIRERIEHNLQAVNIGASIDGRPHRSGETIEELMHDSDSMMIARKKGRKKAEFESLPRYKRLVSHLGEKMMLFAGVNPPRQ